MKTSIARITGSFARVRPSNVPGYSLMLVAGGGPIVKLIE
jgi:hypothetical protein